MLNCDEYSMTSLQIVRNHTGPKRLYEQVADGLESMIEAGTFRPGDRVPSLRHTSASRAVSLSTSLQAYALLESRGLIEARPQSGYFVRPRLSAAVTAPPVRTCRAAPTYVNIGALAARVFEATLDPRIAPLGAACPAPEILPTKKIGKLVSTLARTAGPELNTYAFPPGRLELRRELARRTVDWRYPLAPADVAVTCGATEALLLALSTVTRRGDAVAVESPVYFGTLLLLEHLGLRAVEIPTGPATGLQLGPLARALERGGIKACVASPTCQNPLGVSMPAEARADLLALLDRSDVPLIEDDVYGDAFHGEPRPVPAKADDRRGLVILCSSFSKLAAPGYRVGWIAGGRYHERITRRQLTTTLALPALPQLAMAAFLRSGSYDQYRRRTRDLLARQVALGREAVARHFPAGTRVTRPTGGLVLWVELPPSVDTVRLGDDALRAGISIAPGPLFSPSQEYRNCLRLNCGHPWTPAIEAAVQTLGRLASARVQA